jgi:histidinol-phosphate aminotransferase
MHGHIARITGATVVEGERGADYVLGVDTARRVVRDAAPAVVFLCSPNNPTGLVEDPATVHAVIDAAPGLVVVDEAYAQFASWSALDLVRDDGRLAVVRTFSKTWSMAGARLGYVIAPSWVVANLEKVVLPYHLDVVKQVAGRLALGHVDEMDARVKQIVDERDRLFDALTALSVDVVPSGANFILFRPRALDGHDVWRRLVELGVLVRDCSRWPRLDGCMRVTIGLPAENDRFLSALGTVLE